MDTRGEYMPMKLMKQNKKGKNLLRHLHRRNFFFINYILFYVTKCLRSKKKKKFINGPCITTDRDGRLHIAALANDRAAVRILG